MEFLQNNWIEILGALLVFAKVIVNLTPSEKDNKIFSFIDNIVDAIIPNLKKGGKVHNTNIIVKKDVK